MSHMSAVELLKGNMLIMLADCAAIAFLIIWSNVYDGNIRREFVLLRRKEMLHEAKVITVIGAGLSILCLGVYYLLSYLMGGITFSIWQIIFVVLMVFSVSFVTKSSVLKGNVWVVLLTPAMLFILPMLAIWYIFVKRQSLDIYCNIYSILLLIIIIPALYSWIKCWRKGDLL